MRDVIEALLFFWDPTSNVFRFSNFELTSTLEEIASFIEFGVKVALLETCSPEGHFHQQILSTPKHL